MSSLLYIIYAWLGVAIAEFFRRVAYGATLTDILKDNFQEVVAIRWYLTALKFIALGIAMACALLSLRGIWTLFKCKELSGSIDWLLVLWFIIPTTIGGLALWLSFILNNRISDGNLGKKSVDVTIKSIVEGIDDNEIEDLGLEKYPNRINYIGDKTIKFRIFTLVVNLIIIGTLITSIFLSESTLKDSIDTSLAAISSFYFFLLPSNFGLPVFFDIYIPYIFTSLLLLFAFTNRNYLYFNFSLSQIILFTCIFFSGLWLAKTNELATLRLIILAILTMPLVRIILDLSLLKNYRKRYSKLDPISYHLENVFSQHLSILTQTTEGYPSIDEDKLDERLDQAATNIGKEAFLAPPRFGRYMKNVQVQWRRCASAVSRFLTVDRSVELVNGRSTRDPLRYPKVPKWDEELFPLNVPDAYITWNDRLLLDKKWIVVKTCGRCGGSGMVSCSTCGGSGRIYQTESTYSNGKSVSRTVQRVCTSCSGSGRRVCGTCGGTGKMKYDQQLCTSWRHDFIAAPYPHMKVYELIEGADEFDFVTLKVIEDRAKLQEQPEFHHCTENEKIAITTKLIENANNFNNWSKSVEELHGGITYRAELALSGHTIICSNFGRIMPKKGWLLGNRPDFHFPRLPIGWATVGSFVTVPPVVLLTIAMAFIAFLWTWNNAEKAAIDSSKKIQATLQQ